MAYGSVGAAAGDAFEASMLARRKQQAEDIMRAMDLRKAESDLATAKQDRELNELVKKQQVENLKADEQTKKQKIHDAKVVDFMKRVPMAGMPWAPKLKQEGIELGIDVDSLIAPGQKAQALRFGGPTQAAVATQVAAPEPPAALAAALPVEAPAPAMVPALADPAIAATPDISLVPEDDLRRMTPEAAEREMARRAAVVDRERAAEIAAQNSREMKDLTLAGQNERAADARAQAALFEQNRRADKEEARAEKAAEQLMEKQGNLQDVRDSASDTLNTINQMMPGGKLSPAMLERLGVVSRGGKYVPGTAAANAETLREQLESQLVILTMMALKQQSRSGATGFGALSGPELALIKAASGRLSTMQDPAMFAKALNEIRTKLARSFRPAPWEQKTDGAAGAGGVTVERGKDGKLVPKGTR